MQGVRRERPLRARATERQCRECGGGGCEHGRRKETAESAAGAPSASTSDTSTHARSAAERLLRARAAEHHASAAEAASASTGEYGTDARSAAGAAAASTGDRVPMQGVRREPSARTGDGRAYARSAAATRRPGYSLSSSAPEITAVEVLETEGGADEGITVVDAVEIESESDSDDELARSRGIQRSVLDGSRER